MPEMNLDVFKEIFSRAPFVVDLGIQPDSVAQDGCVTSLVIEPRFLQQNGFVHAGVQATSADHSMGAAAYLFAAAGQSILTADFKMSLLRPAQGAKLICRAKVIKPGRQLVFVEAEVFCVTSAGQEQLTLKASATMAVVSGKA
jgi:uncharacterized protein (TIGR00369 family)